MTQLQERFSGSRAWLWSAALLLILVTLAVAGAACGGSSADAETTASTAGGGGQEGPDFNGVTLDGQAVSLSQYRGKPLVLAFMASW